MILRLHPHPAAGSVLVIVLWVAFGLVSLALYFADSMNYALRTGDHRVSNLQAGQTVEAALRYLTNRLASLEEPGIMPNPATYLAEAVQVGDSTFWLIGRHNEPSRTTQPCFALNDESSKLNVNTATASMLEFLPRMTPELAAAIVDWRDTDTTPSVGGAEDEVYQQLNPPYRCKSGPFESLDELRLVFGMTQEILWGEDTNANGLLDPNENDGDDSPPSDDKDGRLLPGLLEFLTIQSREPDTRTNGEPRINVNGTNQTELATLLQEKFGVDRANQVLQRVGTSQSPGRTNATNQPGGSRPNQGANNQPTQSPGSGTGTSGQVTATTFSSLLDFYTRSGLTADEFGMVAHDLTVTNSASQGLVNVNTASETVLACIPGIGLENAGALVAHRQSNPDKLTSVAWVADVLDAAAAAEAGPYLTAYSYQIAADIAAVGTYGRGFQRVRYVIDLSTSPPTTVERQDLTALGWPLSETPRQTQMARTR